MRLKYSLALVLLLAAGCSQADKAVVTIDLGLNRHARVAAPSFFDRVLAVLTMSTRAEAGTAPGDINLIRINIKGPTTNIALYYSSYDGSPYYDPEMFANGTLTLELPAEPMVFLVDGIFDYPTQEEGYDLLYHGSATVNLTPGENAVNIIMGMLPAQPYLSASVEGGSIYLDFYTEVPMGPIDGYLIYRTTNPARGYGLLTRTTGPSGYFYDTMYLVPDTTYYYRISAYNDFGISVANYATCTFTLITP
jgi:hypothetical protein